MLYYITVTTVVYFFKYHTCCFRQLIKTKVKNDEIWNMLKPDLPTRSLKQRAAFLHGLGSLFNLMVATEGYAIVARAAFIDHCKEIDPVGLGHFAEFSYYCFRLRVCDSELLFNHLVRQLFLLHLAEKLITTSEVAKLYHENTSKEDKKAVQDYIHIGYVIPPTVFDQTLHSSLLALTPAYKKFFYSASGSLLRQHYMEADEEVANINATIIQTALRIKLASRVKAKILRLAQQRRLDEDKRLAEIALKFDGVELPVTRGTNSAKGGKSGARGLGSPNATNLERHRGSIQHQPRSLNSASTQGGGGAAGRRSSVM